jgi:outer membrane lipoprotein LolB
MIKKIICYIYLWLLLLTTSCAFLFDKQVKEVKPYKKPQQVDIVFKYTGRFVISTESESYYGTFTWVKNDDNQQLELRSVLGNTVAKIDITKQANVLQVQDKIYRQDFNTKSDSSEPVSHNEDLNTLLKQYLGFEIPLQYMHYWVQGLPLPQYHIDQAITDGFIQQNWKVEYLQYKDNKPTIVKITRDKLMIKLLIL